MARTLTHADTLDAETLAWLDDAGPEYNDDESDYSRRYADVASAYEGAPAVEPITRKASPHLPDQPWDTENLPCLCSCHFGHPGECDERDCRTWRTQNARRVSRDSERRITRKARRLAKAS